MRPRTISSLVLGPLLLVFAQAHAQTDPLPSWNDGPARKAIVEFVQATTDKASPKFVAPEARIATFDQDGTLWVEHPMSTQVVYCLERVPAVVRSKPSLKDVEPFKTVLSGSREAIAKLPMRDLEKILAATLTGMTVEQFGDEVKGWLATAKHPRFKRPYTELVYQADASSGNQAPDGDEMTPDDARNGESVKARRPMVRQHEALRSSVAGATEACSRSGRSNSLRMACL